ncbi:hypothetical protein HYU19_03470 [Candidatus Woesearchaeota archaeon]|nr:hypothetical protein [Candidatus Woesearchaeota archaeon]
MKHDLITQTTPLTLPASLSPCQTKLALLQTRGRVLGIHKLGGFTAFSHPKEVTLMLLVPKMTLFRRSEAEATDMSV